MPMFQELGITLDTVKSPVSLGVGEDIINIEGVEDIEGYRTLLIKLYPDSESDIDRVIKSIRKIMKHMDVLYGVENPVFKDLKNDREFLFKKLLPWLPKFLFTVRKINRLNMPVEEYLEGIVKNRALRDIISQHFFKNTPTFFAMSYFSLYLDYFYPVGGVKKLADAVNAKVLEFGGEIKRGTEIIAVSANERTVTDSNGMVYHYDNLIWAADLKTFYNITTTEGLSPAVAENVNTTKKLMDSSRGGDSVFTVFMEVDLPPEYFKEIAHGHFFYTPSKEGLGEITQEGAGSAA